MGIVYAKIKTRDMTDHISAIYTKNKIQDMMDRISVIYAGTKQVDDEGKKVASVSTRLKTQKEKKKARKASLGIEKEIK